MYARQISNLVREKKDTAMSRYGRLRSREISSIMRVVHNNESIANEPGHNGLVGFKRKIRDWCLQGAL